ncbi:MAG: hypothetical protein ACOH2M_28840 [Cypionkella sp.]
MSFLTAAGMSRMHQLLLTALVAAALSLLTFAGSFAEAPNSQYLPDVVAPR